MPNTVTARYRARHGDEHLVVVERTPEGRWRVLDIAGEDTIVVETLTGHDDRLAQAEALARDYAAEQDAYHQGLRDNDPLHIGEPRGRRGDVMGGVTTTRLPAGGAGASSYGSGRNAMRILRPQPAMPEQLGAAPRTRGAAPRLRCRVRLADGRVFSGALPPERHRALQLGLLHAETRELVELTPGTRPPGREARPSASGSARSTTSPGGASGRRDWLGALLEHAERIVTGAYTRRRFDGPSARGGLRRRRPSYPARSAARTPSTRRGFCGSTSTSPASCRRCGRSSPSGHATY